MHRFLFPVKFFSFIFINLALSLPSRFLLFFSPASFLNWGNYFLQLNTTFHTSLYYIILPTHIQIFIFPLRIGYYMHFSPSLLTQKYLVGILSKLSGLAIIYFFLLKQEKDSFVCMYHKLLSYYSVGGHSLFSCFFPLNDAAINLLEHIPSSCWLYF